VIVASDAAIAACSSIDTIIFDMDGVLIDITQSIRRAGCVAVPFYLRTFLNWPAPDDLVTSADIEAFKHAGGFNDDMELTRAIVLHYIVKEHEHPNAMAETLNVIKPTLAVYARQIAQDGGGLKAAEEICLRHMSRDHKTEILGQYRTDRIDRCYAELFAGERCEEIYGYKAELYHGPGYINFDRPIVDTTKLPAGLNLGILTGRNASEAKAGLALCGLTDRVPMESVVTSESARRKPDPSGLRLLSKRLDTKVGLYIGDILDDYRTVANYKAKYTDNVLASALVLTGPAGAANRKIFGRSGADVIADDVNEVLDWLARSGRIAE
jgi:phosphoglycolate phosphatase-like HAD superfamily hydrolase